jgi:hypothetical protein
VLEATNTKAYRGHKGLIEVDGGLIEVDKGLIEVDKGLIEVKNDNHIIFSLLC